MNFVPIAAPVKAADTPSAPSTSRPAPAKNETHKTPPPTITAKASQPKSGLGRMAKLRATEQDDDAPPEPTVLPGQQGASEEPLQKVTGRINRTIYEGKDGYTVYSLIIEGGQEAVVSVTSATRVSRGDKVVASGRWSTYKGRPTFKAIMLTHELPQGARGVRAWLASGVIAGVGKGTADKLAKYFGDRLDEVVGNAEILCEAKIPLTRAQAIADAWNASADLPALHAHLATLGLGEITITKVLGRYGTGIRELLKVNPWDLAETIDGIGFKTADAVAMASGHSREAPNRILAGLRHALEEATREGHCGLPPEELVAATADLLRIDRDVVRPFLDTLFDGFHIGADPDVGLVYQQPIMTSERRLAEQLVAMTSGGWRVNLSREEATNAVDRAAQELSVPMDESQREAAITSLSSGLSVITGGPGTGKTTTQRIVVHALGAMNLEVALVAPTGRAAKRLSEVSGMDASTCHRLLQFDREKGGFLHDKDNPFPEDWLVMDEGSMTDVRLGSSFFEAIGHTACATVVGDADQLPSVGPGQVLRDLIRSGVIPVSRLTRVHRQDKDSGIATAAHRINNGIDPFEDPTEVLNGFTMTSTSGADETIEAVLRLLRDELPARGIDPMRDVQVLASMRRGDLGVQALNEAIKSTLNPAADDRFTVELRKRPFTVGDRVMQLRNDYAKGVYNGEVGTVCWVGMLRDSEGAQAPAIKVDYSGYEVSYNASDVGDLEQAWSATVHKSQGCEFPVVIFVCPPEHRRMLNRNLLYTAITRARSECIVIGSKSAVTHAVDTVDIMKRHTGLVERLQRGMAATADLDEAPVPSAEDQNQPAF